MAVVISKVVVGPDCSHQQGGCRARLWSLARWLWVTDVDINKEVVGFGGSCGT